MKLRTTALCAGLLSAIPSMAQVGGFGGPSILTRGTRPAGREGMRPIFFSGSLDLNGIYGQGLTPPATDDRGELVEEDAYGGEVAWTLTARRQARRDSFFVSYGGNYQGYTRATYFSGLNQMLNLTYSRQLTRRWTGFLSQAGLSSNNIFGTVPLQSTDEFSAQLPTSQSEIVDNRFLVLSSAGGLNYQRSARMAFSFSGGFMVQQRRSEALASSNGVIGTASMSYMVSRHQQIGVSYSYGTYYLRRGFGETDIQSTMFTYGRAVSRRWFVNLGGGVYRADSQRLRQVAVDPFIVLLTGQTSTLEVFRGIRQGFSGHGAISGRFRRASIDLRYQRGISPGNGVYFIAETESVGATAGYETTRRWSISVSADWNRMKGVTQDLGTAIGYGAGVHTRYRLNSILHLNGSVQVYRWDLDATAFNRNRIQARAGITISPGEIPLSLW